MWKIYFKTWKFRIFCQLFSCFEVRLCVSEWSVNLLTLKLQGLGLKAIVIPGYSPMLPSCPDTGRQTLRLASTSVYGYNYIPLPRRKTFLRAASYLGKDFCLTFALNRVSLVSSSTSKSITSSIFWHLGVAFISWCNFALFYIVM